ncbi:MAG TPA: O-antigen ligase family protein [Candidatus Nanopelagicales bacterium]|nr:O-antigen ligase family protein [Candidatus Nanopelagicales bacterium]
MGDVAFSGAVAWARSGLTTRVLTLLAALVVGVAVQGGYESRPRLVVVLAVVAAAVLTDWSGGWTRTDTLVSAPAAVVLLWLGLSARYGDADVALGYAATLIACVAGLLVVRRFSSDEVRALLHGTVLLGSVVALAGLGGAVLHVEPLAFAAEGWWRSAAGFTYANATGCFLAACATVALALLADHPNNAWVAAPGVVLLGGTAATLSRGAAIALVVGMVVLLLLRGAASVLAWGPVLVGGSTLAVTCGLSWRAASEPRPLLAAAGLGLAMLVTTLLVRRPPSSRAWWAASVVAVVAGAVLVARVPELSTRVTLGTPRWSAWAAGLESVRAHVLTGTGPGRLSVTWQEAGAARGTTLLHNEYLQVAAELGLVALVLLLVWLGCVLVAMRPGLHRGAPSSYAAGLAGALGILVASAGDFFWHITVLPVLAALLSGAALAACRSAEPAVIDDGIARADGAPAPSVVFQGGEVS